MTEPYRPLVATYLLGTVEVWTICLWIKAFSIPYEDTIIVRIAAHDSYESQGNGINCMFYFISFISADRIFILILNGNYSKGSDCEVELWHLDNKASQLHATQPESLD